MGERWESISLAARSRLARVLRAGRLDPSEARLHSLWLIAGQIAAMDFPRASFRRGRPADIGGNALIEKLWDFWVSARGKPPGVSRHPLGTGGAHGPFVRFVQAFAAEVLRDLEKSPPLGRPSDNCLTTPLRISLHQIATRPEKVGERLKAVRRFWKLPSSTWELPLDSHAAGEKQ